MHNYLGLWVKEIKHISLKPSHSNSKQVRGAFVDNVIHVGYFVDDVQDEELPRRHHRHAQTKSPVQNKNVNLIRFTWLIAGLCPRLRDCVRSLYKQKDRVLCNTFKTTCTHKHRHTLNSPMTGLSIRSLRVIPPPLLDSS